MTPRALAVAFFGVLAVAPADRSRADGAFPDAQSVLLPDDAVQRIIVASNFGLVVSEDGGQRWQYSCEAQATTNGRLDAIAASPDERIFSLADFGIATSADLGCTWRLGVGPFEGGRVLDYFVDPLDGNHVLAVAEPPTLAGLLPAQVFESRDGGRNYDTVLYPGVAGGGISGVEIARADPRARSRRRRCRRPRRQDTRRCRSCGRRRETRTPAPGAGRPASAVRRRPARGCHRADRRNSPIPGRPRKVQPPAARCSPGPRWWRCRSPRAKRCARRGSPRWRPGARSWSPGPRTNIASAGRRLR